MGSNRGMSGGGYKYNGGGPQQFANMASPRQDMPPHQMRQASYKSSHDRKASRYQAQQAENVAILKLTSVNLEKHNKLFPPKRKQVKEVMLTKVILTNCVVAY